MKTQAFAKKRPEDLVLFPLPQSPPKGYQKDKHNHTHRPVDFLSPQWPQGLAEHLKAALSQAWDGHSDGQNSHHATARCWASTWMFELNKDITVAMSGIGARSLLHTYLPWCEHSQLRETNG